MYVFMILSDTLTFLSKASKTAFNLLPTDFKSLILQKYFDSKHDGTNKNKSGDDCKNIDEVKFKIQCN